MVCLLLIPAFVQAADSPEWPQFRGPAGQGHAAARDLPTSWSEQENVAWKCPLPGKGWSSPVIAGNEIWLTTAIDSPLSEAEKAERLKGTTNSQPLLVSGKLSLRALGVDRSSGKLLHDIELLVEPSPQGTHATNSFASPTPVIEAGKLYCHFGAYGTACLDTVSRQVLWTNRDLVVQHENGPGSSPVIWGDLLIFHCDGSDLQYIAALDKRTGKLAWKTDRTGAMNSNPQLKKSYGTPLVAEVAGQPLLLSPASDWLYAYDPAGREVWKLPYEKLGFSLAPRPVVGHGMAFLCTSFMQSELLAVTLDKEKPQIAWRYGRQVPQVPSPLLVGDEIYLVSDKGIATCLDALSGKVHWAERIPGNYSSSPLLAAGHIYCSNREGETTVLAPGKEFRVVGTGKLDGQIMASPAAIENSIYLRTDKALYRIAGQK
ncbi:outer membrane biogenesis protein BamB [Anatilimnocola aggregata]|uniref:Outer membrane biogenesis protein BamB n=2 Tax=Anatilimnocola aggregata TaxID=2528021 RepID=A0A517YAA0_9BACT|nr:outer membrane biogenesis protein BamB [Anatilimnocola aggregata]